MAAAVIAVVCSMSFIGTTVGADPEDIPNGLEFVRGENEGSGTSSAADCPLGNVRTVLSDGVSVTSSLPAKFDAFCLFEFVPIAGQTHSTFKLTGLTSNFDLYVRWDINPTTTSWQCRPQLANAQSETCTHFNGEGDALHVMVRRVSGSGPFTITASGVTLPPTCSIEGTTALTEAVTITATVTENSGDVCYFVFTPSAESDAADFILAGWTGTNQVTLFAKSGALPNWGDFDCYTHHLTSMTCTALHKGEPIYVMVRRVAGAGSFSVTPKSVVSCSLGSGVTTLTEAPITASFTRNFGTCRFKFEPPASADIARFELSAPAWLKLLTNTGSLPDPEGTDCTMLDYTLLTGLEDVCHVATTTGQPVFVTLHAMTIAAPFELNATALVVPTLSNGAVFQGTSEPGTETFYKILVPESATSASVTFATPPNPVCKVPVPDQVPDPDLCTTTYVAQLVTASHRVPRQEDHDCELTPGVGRILPDTPVATLSGVTGPSSTCTYRVEASSLVNGAPDLIAPPALDGGLVDPGVATVPLAGPGKYFAVVTGGLDGGTYVIAGSTA